MQLNLKDLDRLIEVALAEDVGAGDVTSEATIPAGKKGKFDFVTRQRIIICGLPVIKRIFSRLDKKIEFENFYEDGDDIPAGKRIATVRGSARAVLTGERIALNFLQHMSGVATYTNEFVKAVKGTKAKILDTRKTLPGLRRLEKYAVKTGGGYNHRMGLYDAILIKDNHIAICGGIGKALAAAKKYGNKMSIEVECDKLNQVEEALKAGVDIILLDNMSIPELRKAVKLVDGRAKLEASGGVNLATVRKIAETGVDYISIGAITHSAKNCDIGLDML